jgi:hypothetical protein
MLKTGPKSTFPGFIPLNRVFINVCRETDIGSVRTLATLTRSYVKHNYRVRQINPYYLFASLDYIFAQYPNVLSGYALDSRMQQASRKDADGAGEEDDEYVQFGGSASGFRWGWDVRGGSLCLCLSPTLDHLYILTIPSSSSRTQTRYPQH